jgi:hypothetical protein
MKLSTAESLEQAGYMPKQSSREARINALLNPREAIRYAAAELHRISDQLQKIPGFGALGVEDQNRLVLIGYNLGWENLVASIEKRGFGGVIEASPYDNKTLDEYYRWIAE